MEDIMDDDDDGREEIQETTMLELNDSVVQFTQDGGVSVDPDITLSTPHHDTTTDVAHPGSDVVLETVAKGTAVTIDLVEAEDSKEDAQGKSDIQHQHQLQMNEDADINNPKPQT